MRSIEPIEPDVLPEPGTEQADRGDRLSTLYFELFGDQEALGRQAPPPRTLREKVVGGFRRAWYGPDPEPLTSEEMQAIMRARVEDDDLPERVPPDDPRRLAWEAELRAMGVRPATKWNFPKRRPIRRPSVWERIRYRISLGW